MPVFRLGAEPVFPDPRLADESGLLAVGGDLSPARLVNAYAAGIFPWYSRGEPILWWSPDPRLVLEPGAVHVSRSLARRLRPGRLAVELDRRFDEVVVACARAPRAGQRGTWITPAMRRGYLALHELGLAHSVEVLEDGVLVGGLYGVSLGGAFFGESMFSLRADASKVALVRLCGRLAEWGFDLVDCQVRTEHLVRLGAVELPREAFLERLEASLEKPTRKGAWA